MISVVMPAFIASSIESVLAQTYREFELLVIDDGSTDRTLEVANRYAKLDPRVRVESIPHGGVSAAANAALGLSRFGWMARLDADDIALPHRLETQLRYARRSPDVVAWGSYLYQVDLDGKRIGAVHLGPVTEEQYNELLEAGRTVFLFNPTVMLRTDIARRAGGYDSRYDSAEDIELLSRMTKYGAMRTIPEYLIHYRVHGDSITARRNEFQNRVFAFIGERNLAWKRGEDLRFEDYLQRLQSQPAHRRALRRLGERARARYRQAGVYLAEGRRLAACLALAGAFLCSPRFVLGRIRGRYLGRPRVARS